MIPSIALSIGISYPKDSLEFEEIVKRMRQVVKITAKSAVQFAHSVGPGRNLKKAIDYEGEETAGGFIANVMMPGRLKFTMLPGTRPHYIPGGLAVSSRSEASQIQLQKGYPLKFYWQKMGTVVHFWSVHHPGYEGTDWANQVIQRADDVMVREADEMLDWVAERWGGQVQTSATFAIGPAG